ncbi:MAG: hypothetical protein IT259_01150 [Saprospiraceae bacterium]|nr:hypothetical protein [Saprospiraceae bacterium]
MRTILFLSALFAFMSGAFAQGINYQALARNAGGSPIANQLVTAEISIFPDAVSATSLYKENHNLNTDAYGLFNLVIGAGTPAGGSFNAVDWSKSPLYLGIRLNTGSGFTDLGRRPFQGTPFSFYAPEAGKAIDMKLSDLTDVQTAAPANGQVLKWNGSAWAPAADNGQAYVAGTGISISGNTIANTGDLSNTNELQNLAINGNQLSISGGNTVTLPTGGGGGDNWGTQTVVSDATLAGLGTLASPLKLNANAVGTNEIANGSITAADLAAGVIPTTLPPSGSAGGDLGGTYPNPVVDALQGRPVAATAPANGQVLRWSGTTWEPATPSGGSSVWSTNGTSAFYNTGNVGVGTNTPHNRLQLHNSDPLFGSPSALQLTNTGSGNTANDGLMLTINSTIADYGLMGGLMMRENEPLGFGTNNNYHLFLKETGLLGLGTFEPQGKMEIDHNSTSHTNPHLKLTHSSNGYSRISFRSDIAADKYWTIASRTQDSDAASQFNLFYHNGTSGGNILSINGNGNVGVGNFSPSEKFQVDGNARVVKLGINTAPTASEHLNVNGDARISNLGINTSPTERLDVNGNVRVTGEVNRSSTGAANLVPVCYGNVTLTGTINSGTGNFSVERTSIGVYEITITGESYLFSNYVTQATLFGDAGFISTTSVNGKLLVRTYNLGVGAVPNDRNFCFTVFKP